MAIPVAVAGNNVSVNMAAVSGFAGINQELGRSGTSQFSMANVYFSENNREAQLAQYIPVGAATTAAITATYHHGKKLGSAGNTPGVGAYLYGTGTLSSIDGFTLNKSTDGSDQNSRVLVKNQALSNQNGIYYLLESSNVNGGWTMVRYPGQHATRQISDQTLVAADTPSSASYTTVYVLNGSTNGGKTFAVKAANVLAFDELLGGSKGLEYEEISNSGFNISFRTLASWDAPGAEPLVRGPLKLPSIITLPLSLGDDTSNACNITFSFNGRILMNGVSTNEWFIGAGRNDTNLLSGRNLEMIFTESNVSANCSVTGTIGTLVDFNTNVTWTVRILNGGNTSYGGNIWNQRITNQPFWDAKCLLRNKDNVNGFSLGYMNATWPLPDRIIARSIVDVHTPPWVSVNGDQYEGYGYFTVTHAAGMNLGRTGTGAGSRLEYSFQFFSTNWFAKNPEQHIAIITRVDPDLWHGSPVKVQGLGVTIGSTNNTWPPKVDGGTGTPSYSNGIAPGGSGYPSSPSGPLSPGAYRPCQRDRHTGIATMQMECWYNLDYTDWAPQILRTNTTPGATLTGVDLTAVPVTIDADLFSANSSVAWSYDSSQPGYGYNGQLNESNLPIASTASFLASDFYGPDIYDNQSYTITVISEISPDNVAYIGYTVVANAGAHSGYTYTQPLIKCYNDYFDKLATGIAVVMSGSKTSSENADWSIRFIDQTVTWGPARGPYT